MYQSITEKPAVDGSLDRDMKDVTTSSIEAYRYYTEGINLHEGFRGQDAIAPLEKAIAIDPGFAMALAKLAIVHSHLSHPNQYADYARRAFEHIDRITDERLPEPRRVLRQINERRGGRAKAAEYYRRFVQYWREGDIDRERVEEARKKIG